MDQIADILISSLLIIAGLFGLIGSFGLIKLNNPMSRLHAPTLTSTVGISAVLVASMIHAVTHENHLSLRELLISVFMILTAPIIANFIAKTHVHLLFERKDLPDPSPDASWAGLTEGEEGAAPVGLSPEERARLSKEPTS